MTTRAYTCSDGYTFTAHIMSEEALVFAPGGTHILPRVDAAYGTAYSDDAVTFWTTAEAVRLEFKDQIHDGCRVHRADPAWENARLRGVDFRAEGSQPPWEVELTLRDRTVLTTDLGLVRYEFRTPEPTVNHKERRTHYDMRSSRHALDLVLEGSPCENARSGERFPTTVTATLDGIKYTGCGRALR